jgi:hypothetical protein
LYFSSIKNLALIIALLRLLFIANSSSFHAMSDGLSQKERQRLAQLQEWANEKQRHKDAEDNQKAELRDLLAKQNSHAVRPWFFASLAVLVLMSIGLCFSTPQVLVPTMTFLWAPFASATCLLFVVFIEARF